MVIKTMEWASTDPLIDNFDYFKVSMMVFQEEIKKIDLLQKEGMASSVQWSRRFEYPWAAMKVLESTEVRPLPCYGERCLDAGGGNAGFQFFLTNIYKDVYNADWFDEGILELEELKPLAGKGYPNLHFIHGYLPKLPFPDEYFDDSFCISVMEHIADVDIMKSINELLRVTKKRVMITMDVEDNEGSVSYRNFRRTMNELQIPMPPVKNPLVRDVPPFGFIRVACLYFDKRKDENESSAALQ